MKSSLVKCFVVVFPILAAFTNVFVMWTLGTGGFGERADWGISVFFPVYYGIVHTIVLLLFLLTTFRLFELRANKTMFVVYVALTLVGLMCFNVWCTIAFAYAC